MELQKWFSLPIIVLSLSACYHSTTPIDVKEVGSDVYVIDQEKKEVSVVRRDELVLLQRKDDQPIVLSSPMVLERELGITKNLVFNAKFKVLPGKVMYIGQIVDADFLELSNATDTTIDPATREETREAMREFNSDGFNMIQQIADNKIPNAGMTITFRDKDGFKLCQFDIPVKDFVRLTGPSGDNYAGLRLEGEITDSDITTSGIETIELVYRGFILSGD
ncbi:hypothetical protein SAMN05216361_3620 [Marisediminitalea aggregata]|uniref:Lipoprotein n=1 Tax=Marisediminitalea aggregata TaxID=634436 RepID=A0A1M5PVX9_9ALTE|nr:hypothetical protein [Marisediminitalea aggregata]SHH05826.1 hypothetical protein SAMN05216361_3620 [Marisediminitalea aggregata]